jgi:hypothetical protein
MTRDEHLDWCKQRALEYLDAGDLASAATSMLSDLPKHPETALPDATHPLSRLAMIYVMNNDAQGVRRWIEGFR